MNGLRILAVCLDEGGDTPADSQGYFAAACQLVKDGPASLAALVVGPAPGEAHAAHALQAGATEVLTAVHAGLAVPAQPEQWLAVLHPLLDARPADVVAFPAGALGEELAARLSVRMKAKALGLCSQLDFHADVWTATKPLLGGRIQAVVEVPHGPCFVAVRAQKPSTPSATASAPQRLLLDHALPDIAHIECRPLKAGRKPLENARIIVSGGRGVDEPGFALLQELADELGAALGGSLPAVDAGWVPVSHQVGQSGKYVAPDLYVAFGISGTPQHLAGIAPQSRIIAVNNDEDARIFRRAAAGVAADWKLLLPALLRRLRT